MKFIKALALIGAVTIGVPFCKADEMPKSHSAAPKEKIVRAPGEQSGNAPLPSEQVEPQPSEDLSIPLPPEPSVEEEAPANSSALKI